MATAAFCNSTVNLEMDEVKLAMDEKPEEITIHCNGRITARSAVMFEREVRDRSIRQSRGNGVAVINRIVFDLSNVTRIDNAGLKALLDVWAAGQKKCCSVEVVNFGHQSFRRTSLARLNQAFTRMLALFA